jgi:hypothetical protein
MTFHWRPAQTITLATGSALAVVSSALSDHAQAQGKLDASYTISFARIRVGDITATVVLGNSEYAISARGHVGGVMKLLVDGEGSFTTRGTIKHGHPVPTTFSSKIVSNGETSDVTMVLDESSVKELAASPPPGRERVPVTDANRQGIVDPLTAMLFSARFGRKFAPRGTAHITDLRWPTTLRSQARIQAHGQGDSRKRVRRASGGVFRRLRTDRWAPRVDSACQISF